MADNNESLQGASAQINCAKGCGFFGSASTMNMCSKCFRDHTKTTGAPDAVAPPPPPSPLLSVATGAPFASPAPRPPALAPPQAAAPPAFPFVAASAAPSAVATEDEEEMPPPRKVQKNMNRCFSCRKKVGLTGFKCRCGYVYCGEHRYSDKHECDHDYKTEAKELLEKNNPMVVASKLDRI
jgi:hypothetical protein